VIVVGATLAWTPHKRRTAFGATKHRVSHAESGHLQRLHVRSKGPLHFISTAEVDWIGAAVDYAEVHAGGAVHLVERSLHSSASCRMASLPVPPEARSFGSPASPSSAALAVAASAHLSDGTELRLSRRYRPNLAALLRPADRAVPLSRGMGPAY
jgi:hypothetical protein